MKVETRDYSEEYARRVAFIRATIEKSGASGIVYGNSGGKDSALVGILCKAACGNTVGVMLPCSSARNFGIDLSDGKSVADKYGIETRMLDLTPLKALAVETVSAATTLSPLASANIAPRLRMTALYAIAGSENRLVAGTGNRSEAYMGYFTKWGDGAYDFDPIADLTVTEIYEFLRFLDAPRCVIDKAPSAALFEGQTDEGEMGISYASLDRYLFTGEAEPEVKELIEGCHRRSGHKRALPLTYSPDKSDKSEK